MVLVILDHIMISNLEAKWGSEMATSYTGATMLNDK